MKYLMLKDLEGATEADDGVYLIKARLTKGSDPSEATLEAFSEGDLYRIGKNAPPEANAVVLKDDWMYLDTQTGRLLGYVFRE